MARGSVVGFVGLYIQQTPTPFPSKKNMDGPFHYSDCHDIAIMLKYCEQCDLKQSFSHLII